MEQLTTTPFGRRPVTAGLVAHVTQMQRAPGQVSVDKWNLLRDLCTARKAFGLSDRDLTVLNALLSFHPKPELCSGDRLVVFPSNRSLSERAHGMAESTLRRHIAALVKAGIIARHDSPNGKRYVRRNADGEISRAFGFDLRPMLVRAEEIAQAADTARAEIRAMAELREVIALKKRDVLKLTFYARDEGIYGDWNHVSQTLISIQRLLRRKLSLEDLRELDDSLSQMLEDIQSILIAETEDQSGCDSQNERHCQNSKPDFSESEIHRHEVPAAPPALPLPVVLQACSEATSFSPEPIQTWQDFIHLAQRLRGMIGICPSAWENAVRQFGAVTASIAVCCILQRFDTIRSPGAYLRALTAKAQSPAGFSPVPMVMALLGDDRQVA